LAAVPDQFTLATFITSKFADSIPILNRYFLKTVVGGIYTANDSQDYLSAGATAVQLASALTDDGVSVFDKILYQAR